MAGVATKKRIRLQPSTIKKLAILKSRVIYTEESETFGDVEKEFNNEDESDDAIDHTDKPFISCAEDGDETDEDD
ncbi:hypothetical protein JCM33374_g5125 [Metschnikowia sp. JCM 33374]|nr:hypothetical protein JCM33374_g5125 [Metschnikowia sp. JCM 33374]